MENSKGDAPAKAGGFAERAAGLSATRSRQVIVGILSGGFFLGFIGLLVAVALGYVRIWVIFAVVGSGMGLIFAIILFSIVVSPAMAAGRALAIAHTLRSKELAGTNVWWQIGVERAHSKKVGGCLLQIITLVGWWAIWTGVLILYHRNTGETLAPLLVLFMYIPAPLATVLLMGHAFGRHLKTRPEDFFAWLEASHAPPNEPPEALLARLRARLGYTAADIYLAQKGEVREWVGTLRQGGFRTLVVVYEIPCEFPSYLTVHPEGVIEKTWSRSGIDDLNLESKQFSDTFWVNSGEDKFAYALLHSRMMEFLLDNPSLQLDLFSGCLLLTGRYQRDAKVESAEYLSQCGLEILKLLPRHILQDARRVWLEKLDAKIAPSP